MLFALRRLSLGIVLIILAAGILLLSDWGRRTPRTHRIPRAALMQHASVPLVDEGVQGMVDGLAANGFVDGKTILIQKFNAEGDIAVANAIAREMVTGDYELLLTATTPTLQIVANANRSGKKVQVFGITSDPPGAGVGISRENPLDHPRNLVGVGSFLPVAELFAMARELYPALKTVGVAWNPAEANSAAYVRDARLACKKLGINLLETPVENSAGVREATDSLVSRGVQALWVSSDLTVSVALQSVLASAQKGRIPVFTLTPDKPDRGTLLDYGVSYHGVGMIVGEIGARVLRGVDPATIPFVNAVPTWIVVNKLVLKGLKDPWRIPEDLMRRADAIVDETGVHRNRSGDGKFQPSADSNPTRNGK
jgi:ABC-type uncharacterized transport system substrate-binding protein